MNRTPMDRPKLAPCMPYRLNNPYFVYDRPVVWKGQDWSEPGPFRKLLMQWWYLRVNQGNFGLN